MSGHEHLSEDALLAVVYGIAGGDAEMHLRACADCAQRLHEWHGIRVATATGVEISDEFLAAQRRKIYERIERPASQRWLWAPGLVAACALAVGIFVYHPAPRQASVKKAAEISDAQLFGDIYSMEQTVEPAASATVRALFEEQQ